MVPKTEWNQQVGGILAVLEQYTFTVLGRLAMQELFGVSKRQALRIGAQLGAVQSSWRIWIEKARLVEKLEQMRRGAAFA